MIKLKGRLITTHITRDNIRFTKEGLEKGIAQINSGDKIMPCNINHDSNKQVGFIVPGTAKLIELPDGEYAIEAEINIYETEEERLKYYVSFNENESEVFLDSLKIKALKKEDINCPTYRLQENIFDISKVSPLQDKEGLFIVSDPKIILSKGILINEDILVLFHAFLRRGFSEPNAYNKRVIEKLREIKLRNQNIRLSFLINPFTISFKSEFKELIECDYAWGPKIPRDLSNLREGVTKYISSEKDKAMDNLLATEFWWRKQERYIMELEIEELRDKLMYLLRDNHPYFPLRYAHLQYDKKVDKIIHLDCAIRIYPAEKYNGRLNKNDISKATKKDSVRIKLFKLDGIMEAKDAFDVISLFFMNNSDVRDYLELAPEES